jgi:hypothetical protein
MYSSIFASYFKQSAMNKIFTLAAIILASTALYTADAQGYTHEAGAAFGYGFFQSDFGEREGREFSRENPAISISVIHYLNFPYRLDRYWNEHFKIRNELSYLTGTLENYGPTAESNSTGGQQLRAMEGNLRVIQVGSSLEYHFGSISDFRSGFGSKWDPFLGLGVRYVLALPDITTTFGDGDIDNLNNIFPTFQGRIDNDARSTVSFRGDFGTRYKLDEKNDLFISAGWTYFGNNQVEGLSPNNPNNRANDWHVSIQAGYIYSFGY